MTKKHFQALALALHTIMDEDGVWNAACKVADVCEQFNDNFDRTVFLSWVTNGKPE